MTTAESSAQRLPAPHSLGRSSTGLLVGKGSQMALGYAFWLVAAHVAAPEVVGQASGTVSGIMIVTQLCLLGVGAAVILRLPLMLRDQANSLVDAALTLVGLSALAGGAAYVVVIRSTSPHLQDLFAEPTVAGIVLVACMAGTVAVCLDQVSTALGRGGMVVPRDVSAGAIGVLLLVLVGTSVNVGASLMLASWALGFVVSVLIGLVQLRHLIGYRVRPRLVRAESGPLLRDGIPNQVLTLTERVPALLLPVLISGYVSPTMGAYWYPVWMMAWAVFLAPVSVGLAQFAADVRATHDLRTDVRGALRWSLLLGGALAVVVWAAAPLLLGFLGPEYAESGTAALRVLLMALPGTAVIQAYFAASRACRRLGEATLLGIGVGLAACTGAMVAALTVGLVAVAGAWVAAQTIGGLVAGWRLHVLVAAGEAGP